MNDSLLLSTRVAQINAESEHCADFLTVKPQQLVGDSAEPMSDGEREIAIKRAGEAMTAAMGRKEAARRRYLESSCLTDRADMDAADMQARQALRLMEGLIKGRSAAQVARMERERGIA